MGEGENHKGVTCKWGDDTMLELVKNLASLTQKVSDLEETISDNVIDMKDHIKDAEKPGGWHTQINDIKTEVKNLKSTLNWKRDILMGAIGGCIGGVIISGVPEVLMILGRILVKIFGV